MMRMTQLSGLFTDYITNNGECLLAMPPYIHEAYWGETPGQPALEDENNHPKEFTTEESPVNIAYALADILHSQIPTLQSAALGLSDPQHTTEEGTASLEPGHLYGLFSESLFAMTDERLGTLRSIAAPVDEQGSLQNSPYDCITERYHFIDDALFALPGPERGNPIVGIYDNYWQIISTLDDQQVIFDPRSLVQCGENGGDTGVKFVRNRVLDVSDRSDFCNLAYRVAQFCMDQPQEAARIGAWPPVKSLPPADLLIGDTLVSANPSIGAMLWHRMYRLVELG